MSACISTQRAGACFRALRVSVNSEMHTRQISTAPGFPRVTHGDEINSAFNYKARLVADRALKLEKDILAVVFTCRRNTRPSKEGFRITSKIELCRRGAER